MKFSHKSLYFKSCGNIRRAEMCLEMNRIRVSTSRTVATFEDREIRLNLDAYGKLYQELQSISRKWHLITIKISIIECITMMSLVKCLPCAYTIMLWNFRDKRLVYVAPMAKSICYLQDYSFLLFTGTHQNLEHLFSFMFCCQEVYGTILMS